MEAPPDHHRFMSDNRPECGPRQVFFGVIPSPPHALAPGVDTVCTEHADISVATRTRLIYDL